MFIAVFIKARNRPIPRTRLTYRNKLDFYGELLALRPNPDVEGHPLSTIRERLFSTSPSSLHAVKNSSRNKCAQNEVEEHIVKSKIRTKKKKKKHTMLYGSVNIIIYNEMSPISLCQFH
jgi:hypothetical protein